VVARKNILAPHYPHARTVDQRVGLHYTRFRDNARSTGKENQELEKWPRSGAALFRIESAKCG
jgi:hypothetical protein